MLKYFISDITIWTCLCLQESGADAYVQLELALFFANIFEKVANDSCPWYAINIKYNINKDCSEEPLICAILINPSFH